MTLNKQALEAAARAMHDGPLEVEDDFFDALESLKTADWCREVASVVVTAYREALDKDAIAAEDAGNNGFNFTYKNHRGEVRNRSVIPTKLWFGSTEWHPEPQWFLGGIDVAKGAYRDFALKDIGADALRRNAEHLEAADAILCAQFKRRVPVEEYLLAAAAGKAPLPDAEKCRELAQQIGVPNDAWTYGHCENRNQPGGCPLNNFNCGYPKCDRRVANAPTSKGE